jgi:hypothetical protein
VSCGWTLYSEVAGVLARADGRFSVIWTELADEPAIEPPLGNAADEHNNLDDRAVWEDARELTARQLRS